jgi:hypothetical protein
LIVDAELPVKICKLTCSYSTLNRAYPVSSLTIAFQSLVLLKYTATFQRLESRPSSPAQGAASLGSSNPSAGTTDNSLAETFQLVSRPLPYDTDPRYTRVQREGLVSRRDKSINLTQEESLALRRNGSSSAIEHLASHKKRSSTDTDPDYKVHRSESTKSLSAKAYSSSYTVVTSEDEDVCPTCLEGLYSC